MKKLSLIFLSLLAFGTLCFAQNQNSKPLYASSSEMPAADFLSGVKYASIALNPVNQGMVDNQEGIAAFYFVAQQYLQQIGFEYVALTSNEKTILDNTIKSYCESATVIFGGDIDKKSISNMTITFVSCKGDVFGFRSQKKFSYGLFADVEKKVIEDWKSIQGPKGPYQISNQLSFTPNKTKWTAAKAKEYYLSKKDNLSKVEGVYERVRISFEDFAGGKYSMAILPAEDPDEYLIIYLSGARNDQDWKAGELKGRIQKTATANFFTVEWIGMDKSVYDDVYANLDSSGIVFYSSGISAISYQFIKVFPVQK